MPHELKNSWILVNETLIGTIETSTILANTTHAHCTSRRFLEFNSRNSRSLCYMGGHGVVQITWQPRPLPPFTSALLFQATSIDIVRCTIFFLSLGICLLLIATISPG
jgi:hypothetical protein